MSAAPETFTIPSASLPPPAETCWDAIAGQGELGTDLGDWLDELDRNPALRAAATLRALERIRLELSRCPSASTGLEDPIQISVRDAALLARQVLARLR